MISEQELLRLRNLSSQKQSNLNGLLSEKQSLNSTISHYKSLNQTQSQQYINSLNKLSSIESQILEYSVSIKEIESNIEFIEQKLSEIAVFEDFMQDMDSILSEYSSIEGQRIDQSTMMVKALPQSEIMHTDLPKEVCREKCLEAFKDLVTKLDDINAVDSEGRTLLMHALSHGFFPAVDILLANPDLDFNILDSYGQNALVYACSMPHIEYLKKILDLTEDINLQVAKTGNTPLHFLIAASNYRLFGDEYSKYYDSLQDGSDNDYISGFEGTLVFNGNNISIGGYNPITFHTINQAKTLLLVEEFLKKGVDLNTQNNQGHTPFIIACAYQLKYLVNSWLDQGIVDINFQDDSGKTTLYWMSQSNDFEMVDFLLKLGASHDVASNQGFYPIHAATHNSFFEVMEVMFKHGVSINTQSISGFTPLYYSIACGFPPSAELIDYLLSKGADPLIANNIGFYPIHGAACNGYTETLNKLIESGVDIDLLSQSGMTPLHLSLQNVPQVDLAKFLIDSGADVHLTDNSGNSILHYSLNKCSLDFIDYLLGLGININIQNASGQTPFYLASILAKIKVMDFLLKAGADINIPNIKGFYPIHAAIQYGSIEVVKFLVSNGMGISKLSDNGITPLYFAITNTGDNLSIKLIDYLLEQGALPNQAIAGGYTPIYSATEKGRLDIIKLLVAKGGDIEQGIDCGDTPMAMAAYMGNIEIMQYFQEVGADICVQNKKGDMPIHEAHMGGKIDVIDYLLAQGVDINIQNDEGKTPLHFLLEWVDTNIETKLAVIDKYKDKYNLSLQDKDGKTPLDYAQDHCLEALSYLVPYVNVLEEYEGNINIASVLSNPLGENDIASVDDIQITGSISPEYQ